MPPAKTCKWLEGGLAFSPRAVHACCVCHNGSLGWPELSPYDGGELPVQDILVGRQKILAAINSTGYGPCAGCPLLEEREPAPESPPFREFNLSHSTVCNIRCHYCYLQGEMSATDWWNDPERLAQGKKPLALLEPFKKLVTDGHVAPGAVVNWGGGEPALLEEFEDMVDYLDGQGLNQYVATNATVFSPAVARAMPNGRMGVVTSVDCGTPGTYLALKKRDYFGRVWENLGQYARAGGVVEAKYIVTNHNLDHADLDGFVNRAAKTGVTRIICDVDAFEPSLSKEVVTGLARLRDRAEELGVEAKVAGCGVGAFQDKDEEAEKKSHKKRANPLNRLARAIKSYFSGQES